MSLDAGIDFTAAPSVGAAGVTYPEEHQLADNWCWAACTQMVVEYYSLPAVQQCSIASTFLAQPNCCVNPTPSPCDQGYAADGIAGVLSHYGANANYNPSAIVEAPLRAELDAKRPVEVM